MSSQQARTRRVVRAPNHLGDVVAALPALVADGSDVLVVRWLAPIVEMGVGAGEVIPFDRGLSGFARAVGELRRRRYQEGILLTPAFSAAWLLRCGGVGRLRGTTTDGRTPLLADRIPPEALRPYHRINAYKLLLGQDSSGEPSAHRLVPDEARRERWRAALGPSGPVVGLVPGSNAPARRWPVDRFATLAAALRARGARLVVMGGSRETPLTARVAGAVPGALDLGGRTDLADLAALLSVCDLVVTNDTGPMHLAGAVGTPTVSIWGPSDPEEVRQLGAPDIRVVGAPLPCKPCRRNHCHRRGVGTVLAQAHEECMRQIELEAVLEAVEAALDAAPDGGIARA